MKFFYTTKNGLDDRHFLLKFTDFSEQLFEKAPMNSRSCTSSASTDKNIFLQKLNAIFHIYPFWPDFHSA